MKKHFIISDTVLLGRNFEESKRALLLINSIQNEYGHDVIIMSNRPMHCMRNIGGVVSHGNIQYYYPGHCSEKGNGVNISFRGFDPADQRLEEIINIRYDYSIFGSGLAIVDEWDDIIYPKTMQFMDRELLLKLAATFESHNYKPVERCFTKADFAYKFFEPMFGSPIPTDTTYGMQCSQSESLKYDQQMIKNIEAIDERIVGYILNGKPCFYLRDNDKWHTLYNGLVEKKSVNLDNAIFFLGCETENLMAENVSKSAYGFGDNSPSCSKKADSLLLALKKEL